jgi:simple sugar transport system permease protein
MYGAGIGIAVLTFVALPILTQAWWPFIDDKDRLHIGLFLAIGAAIFVWWLLYRTTIGFELRTIGANPAAAQYAGVKVKRNIVLAMALSGSLAGLAGAVELMALEHSLPIFFSSGYGFDGIAIALVAHNDPFAILLAAFLWGSMRNGADLMELRSGVSKYVISLIQALMLLFVAAPAMIRWLYRLPEDRRLEEEAPLTRGWGG